MTAEEFAEIDDWSHRHELIKGELLTMPPPQLAHGRISANLIMILGQFVKANRLGQVFGEGGYQIPSSRRIAKVNLKTVITLAHLISPLK